MATELKTTASQNPVAGDDLRLSVTITGVPSGVTITKAWVTFKTSRSTADPGTLQKVVTTGFSVSGTTTTFNVDISNSESLLFTVGTLYLWDLQSRDNSNRVSTLIQDGTVVWSQGTAAATT